MTHEELNELYELYVLEVLEDPATGEIERHLSEGCAYCREQIQKAFSTTAALAGLVETATPPKRLRRRVLAGVMPVPAVPRNWIWATAALSALSLGLLGVVLWFGSEMQTLHGAISALTSERGQLLSQNEELHRTVSALSGEQKDLQSQSHSFAGERSRLAEHTRSLQTAVAALTAERDALRGRLQKAQAERAQLLNQRQSTLSTVQMLNKERDELLLRIQTVEDERNNLLHQRGELQSIVDVIGNPATRALQFGEHGDVPHGRVFLAPQGGVTLVGLGLPQVAVDRTFQLWLVPGHGAPISAGVFRPDASGEAVYSSRVSTGGVNPSAVAVSVEPQGGSPAPTTKPFIVVPLKS